MAQSNLLDVLNKLEFEVKPDGNGFRFKELDYPKQRVELDEDGKLQFSWIYPFFTSNLRPSIFAVLFTPVSYLISYFLVNLVIDYDLSSAIGGGIGMVAVFYWMSKRGERESFNQREEIKALFEKQ